MGTSQNKGLYYFCSTTKRREEVDSDLVKVNRLTTITRHG